MLREDRALHHHCQGDPGNAKDGRSTSPQHQLTASASQILHCFTILGYCMLRKVCKIASARNYAQFSRCLPSISSATRLKPLSGLQQQFRQYSASSPSFLFEKIGRWFEMKKFEKDTPWAQMETAVGESFDIYQAAMNRKQECEHDEAARLFQISADLGFTEAMVQLAICYREGWGVVKSEATSIEHFQKAADKGHTLASFAVGQHFARLGDKDQAAKYFLTSHEEYRDLAVRYQKGENIDFPVLDMEIEKDVQLEELAKMGEDLMYGTEYTSADPEGALEYLLAAADKGHRKAQFEMGMAHATGTGTEKDMKMAIRFFKLAADQGHDISQAFVGETYLEEPVDIEKALLYLTLASDQGNAAAHRNLGYLHASGNGVPQDMKKAVAFFKAASGQDDWEALSTLATCYITGAGVDVDEDTALQLLVRADSLGHHEAFYIAGQVYEIGVGLFGHEVPKNMQKAVEYYHRAAERGQPDALYSLGGCYFMGNGVEKDTKKAKEFLRRAVDAGHEKAAVMYGKLEDGK